MGLPMSSRDQAKARREDFFEVLSGATNLTLTFLQGAASLAPVPYLGQAATLATGIWDSVQATRGAKSALISLAEDACALVYTVWTTCDEILQRKGPKLPGESKATDLGENTDSKGENEEEKLSPQLEAHLKKLCSTLWEISEFASHIASRNAVKRFLTSKADANKVADYQSRLKSALDTFTLQANITIQQVLSRVETQQRLMHAQLSASPYRPLSVASDGITHPVNGVPDPPNVASPQLSVGQAPTERGVAKTEAEIGAQAFPAIFSFAGATFRAGGTVITNQKGNTPLQHGSRPKSSEDLAKTDRDVKRPVVAHETSDQSAREEKENRNEDDRDDASDPRAGFSRSGTAQGGSITFSAITGGQNITRVNDSSQKSNFGNVYNIKGGHNFGQENTRVNQALGRDDGIRKNSERSYDVPRTGNDWDGQDGRHFGYNSYGSHTAPIHRIEHGPRSTYYNENGVPTAIPQRRWHNGPQGEDDDYSERDYDVGGRSWRSSRNPFTEETEMHGGGRGTSDWGTWDAQRSFHVPQRPKTRSAYHNESSTPATLRQGPNRPYWQNSNRA